MTLPDWSFLRALQDVTRVTGLQRTTAPTRTALTLEEAIEHLRLEADAPDLPLVMALCQAADAHIEQQLQRSLCTQSWQLTLDAFPLGPSNGGVSGLGWLGATTLPCAIELRRGPVQSVTTLKYIDSAGTLQTLAANTYQVDTATHVPRVLPAYGTTWPSARAVPGAVQVVYIAGYGDPADVPPDIKCALRLMLGHLYENREAVVTGTIATQLPLAVDALLAPHRVLEVS